MDQERIWILLTRHIAGEASIEEEEELEWAFLANPRLRSTLDLILALKQAPLEGLSSEEEQQLLEKGLQRFAASSESRYRSRTLPPADHEPPAIPVEDAAPYLFRPPSRLSHITPTGFPVDRGGLLPGDLYCRGPGVPAG